MDFLSFRRRLLRRSPLLAWLLCAVLLVGGLCANLYAMSHTISWLQARKLVAVDGTLLMADSYYVGKGKHSTMRLTVDYRYDFNGRQYTGSTVGLKQGVATIDGATEEEAIAKLRAIMDGDKRVRVWVDPARPNVSRLDRTLDWAASLGITAFAFFAMMYGLAVGTRHSTLARGTVFDAHPSPWRSLAFLALIGNLSGWPLVFITLWELPQSGQYLVFASLFSAVGVFLALAAARGFRAEQRLGAPYVQYFQEGPATIRLRFHFRPAFGERCTLAEFSGAVSVEVRQIVHPEAAGHFDDRARIAWRVVAGPRSLARGTRFFDVVADLPDWPDSPDGFVPAYWEIVLAALGGETHFWLPPDL
jgi:hypothetical protein